MFANPALRIRHVKRDNRFEDGDVLTIDVEIWRRSEKEMVRIVELNNGFVKQVVRISFQRIP